MKTKHYEADAPRWYGKTGAWSISVLIVCIMAFMCAIMAYVFWKGLLVWIAFNVAFVVYFYAVRIWLNVNWHADYEPVRGDDNAAVA